MSAVWTEHCVKPPAALRELDVRVRVFERVAGGAYARTEPASHRAVLIFGRNGAWRTRTTTNQAQTMSAFGAGSTTQPVKVESSCVDGCVEISMPPWIAMRLMPEWSQLGGAPVPVQEVLSSGAELAAIASEAPDLKCAGERIARSISGTLARVESVAIRPDIEWAWRKIARLSGDVRVQLLADDVGLSERQFTAQFQKETGFAPKMAARILRFHAALKRLKESSASLSEIAYACGYSDQSHMNRDFAAFSGSAPGALRKRAETVRVIGSRD